MMVKVLPVPVAPSRTWCLAPFADTLDQLLDGLRLVAGGLEGCDELELRHAPR